MFVHSGWLHRASNLIALWIFGDNVEDRMGHGRFLASISLAGARRRARAVLGRLGLVGCRSSARAAPIAGVMGAYLVLFPHSRVLVLVCLFVFV